MTGQIYANTPSANRLFGPDKPFGIIKYYTFPYTMEQNIEDALEVYVDRPLGVFVDKLEQNLDRGLVFAGANAWRITEIVTVKQLMDELKAAFI